MKRIEIKIFRSLIGSPYKEDILLLEIICIQKLTNFEGYLLLTARRNASVAGLGLMEKKNSRETLKTVGRPHFEAFSLSMFNLLKNCH